MPGIKELKTRIKSIQSTRKITRAMQMVSAAKMRKSQTAVLESRTYAELAWELVNSIMGASASIPENLSASENLSGIQNRVLTNQFPEAKKIGIVLLTTNGGLVGSLNTNLLNLVKKMEVNGAEVEFITYGKKGGQAMARMGVQIMADFAKNDRSFNAEEIVPLAQMVSEKYATGEYQKIYLAYNHFNSTLSQKPELKQLLPFNSDKRLEKSEKDKAEDTEFLFEPTPEIVLNHLLPRILESQIYEAVLESNASEHSARMIMMKNATESAGDLIADYTLTYNQLRQGKITTELAEITAGKIALE